MRFRTKVFLSAFAVAALSLLVRHAVRFVVDPPADAGADRGNPGVGGRADGTPARESRPDPASRGPRPRGRHDRARRAGQGHAHRRRRTRARGLGRERRGPRPRGEPRPATRSARGACGGRRQEPAPQHDGRRGDDLRGGRGRPRASGRRATGAPADHRQEPGRMRCSASPRSRLALALAGAAALAWISSSVLSRRLDDLAGVARRYAAGDVSQRAYDRAGR